MKNDKEKNKETNEIIDVPATLAVDATPTGILQAIDIADYSQFLYNANMGGKAVTDFTSEGIKTIALQYGISTGEVSIKFLEGDSEAAIFSCTATNPHGQTASVNVWQSKFEKGRENRFWIEKGTTRAIRNAQKALLPVDLLKSALQKAIAKGEAEQGDIAAAQKRAGAAYKTRTEKQVAADTRGKRELLGAAEEAWGLANTEWDSELWHAFADALETEDFDDALEKNGY